MKRIQARLWTSTNAVYEKYKGGMLLPTAAFDRLDIAMIEKTADGGGLP